MKRKINVVDLFCGCGGMTLGFQEAGFNILAGFEHWNDAISCYKKNFLHPVEDIDLSNVELSVETVRKYKPYVIIGGPPCQDFSGAGNRIEGARADLTVAYARIIAGVLPQYFVMENVERAASSEAYKKARKIFKENGYGLTEKIIDASFCGVPQRRRRFFCIGYINGQDGFLDGLLSTNQSVFPLTVREYFQQKNYKLEIEYYYRHPRSYSRRGIFSVDEPSPTIRGVNRPKPKGYKRHNGDLVNPDEVRSLSSLERSLIQTFPIDFVWGQPSVSVEKMIGNAVPVKLAGYVAWCLMRFINGDFDLHNLRFGDWLKSNKCYSPKVSGDILSRISRARRMLEFERDECEVYLDKLNKEEAFERVVPSVRNQIRKAVKLYFEYIYEHEVTSL